MADMQPPELHLLASGGGGGGGASVIPASNQVVTSSETVGSKRQRRPSVRLGDIGGDTLYDPYSRKAIAGTSASSKQWKQQVVDQKKDSSKTASKTRALTNLTSGGEYTETLDESKELNLEKIAIGSWRVKETKKRAPISSAKRVRSSWVTKVEEGGGNSNAEGDFDEKYSGGGEEDMDDENSDTPSKEDSHENLGDGNERNDRDMYYNKRSSTKSGNHHHHNHNHNMSNHHHHHQDGVELLSVPSETDTRGGGGYRENNNNNNNNEMMCGAGEDGVRIWLDNLGLGRYAPVFEIHEVDDEVLPMLTLEDLKDMGINAVGSRRKMFAAIQKLNKGFS